ncbi:MAG: hypothetical protein AAF689_15055 [Pseudomonadota bacterium]
MTEAAIYDTGKGEIAATTAKTAAAASAEALRSESVAVQTIDLAALAAEIAESAFATDDFTWGLVRADARYAEMGQGLLRVKLWHEAGNPVDDLWADVQHRLSSNRSWSFWLAWYQAALDGKPLNEKLLIEIASQNEAVWDGPDAEVNARISEIFADFEAGGGAGRRGGSATFSLSALRQQISTLRSFLHHHHIALCGVNDTGDAESAARIDRQITLLASLIEATDKMAQACEGDEPGTALAVIEDQLPVVVAGADEIAKSEETPDISAAVISMTLTVEYLTGRGWSQKSAERIAFAEYMRTTLLGWLKGK